MLYLSKIMDIDKYSAVNGVFRVLMKKISIPEESYWKLIELKSKYRCNTWKELIDLLHRKMHRTSK